MAKKKNDTPKTTPPAGRWTLREIFTGKRRNEVYGLIWWAACLLLLAALIPHTAGRNALGPAGEVVFRLGFAVMGVMLYLLPLFLVFYGLLVFRGEVIERRSLKVSGLILGGLALGILIELIHPEKIHLGQVRAFYTWKGASDFWAGLPAFLRLWNDHLFAAGGSPAAALERLMTAVFSKTGAFILGLTALVISFYLLEVEPIVAGLVKRFFLKIRSGVSQGAEVAAQLDYAPPKTVAPKTAKPGKDGKETKETAKAAVMAAAEEKPKIKINVPQPLPALTPRPKDARETVVAKAAVPGNGNGANRLKDSGAPNGEDAEASAIPAADLGDTGPKNYRLPGLDLLNDPKMNAAMTAGYFESMSATLENALAQFGVAAKVVEVCPGPVVTRYELQPSPGVKVNRIISLADDIALAMKAEHVRLEAPIPGKGAVGIEIPNQEKQVVVLKELIATDEFLNAESILTVAVGKDIGGKHIFARLEAMPHLLIAGATGSGKSACINGLLSSLLYRAKPDQVKFVMIDPKRVELTTYNGIPHLKSPVITDPKEAAVALRFLVKEMEDRYRKLAELGVRDIASYNQKVAEELQEKAAPGVPKETGLPAGAAPAGESGKPVLTHMPYIVIVIDELADLMLVAANDVENAITRLAQMARGVGMHLVLATQRPSVDVITGVIKANFPSRIAFQVSSKVDSRTILDTNGADSLLGRGDMLYAPASASKPLRVQGVFITTAEVDRIVKFWKEQGAPVYDNALASDRLKAGDSQAGGEGDGEHDEHFEEAVAWVIRAKQASTSMLQRRLKVGYSRAARLLDLMEQRGIVGPPDGSKPRKVLVSDPAEGTGQYPEEENE